MGRRATKTESAEEQHRGGTIATGACSRKCLFRARCRNVAAVTPSEARAAKNEVSFRKANERLGEKRRELDVDGKTPFLCECSDPHCTEIVQLTSVEYEQVRSNPTWFLIAAGHEAGATATIKEYDAYTVVEKGGVAGKIAKEEDPRDE